MVISIKIFHFLLQFQYNHNNINVTRDRVEDDIIAWTWREFLENTDDPNILLRWPMCKVQLNSIWTRTAYPEGKNVLQNKVTHL